MTFDLAFDLQVHIQGQRRVPDIIQKLHRNAYQNGLKRQLASLGSLHSHDIEPDI